MIAVMILRPPTPTPPPPHPPTPQRHENFEHIKAWRRFQIPSSIMKIFVFWFKFQWNVFIKCSPTIYGTSICSDGGLEPIRWESINWANHSLGPISLTIFCLQLAYFTWLFKCMCECLVMLLFHVMYFGIGRFSFCSYATRTFTSVLVIKGQISVCNICPILKPALYKYHIIIIINSNSMETSPCCNSVAGHQIATIFCTCHYSTAVVPCTKFCSDHGIRLDVRVKRNFHRIWIPWKNR